MNLSTRPVQPDDLPFLFRVYSSTRKEELELLAWSPDQKLEFLRQQFEAQSRHYEDRFPGADHCVVECDGEPVGRIHIARSDGEIRLLDIAVVPEHRRRGIGSMLLRRLQAEAEDARKPLHHMVEKNNPEGIRFYRRLGFGTVADAGTHVLMEWPPPCLESGDRGRGDQETRDPEKGGRRKEDRRREDRAADAGAPERG